ncbi:MAG TPA: ABC transporter ATP-binding protein [Polyangia bacterium]|jgi:simple sugar transport system ATP-binding protein
MTSPALELRGVTKRFGAVLANDAVDLTAAAAEIHALCGENGAGKSTLMRIVYGLLAPDAGEILLHGEPLRRHAPAEAIARGLGMVHQHFTLVPTLTVAENLVLGCEPRRLGLFDRGAAAGAVRALMKRYDLGLEPDRLAGDLSVGEQQRLEIAKVLHRGADVLVLDEPTAVLTPPEVTQLFGILRELRQSGRAVVVITHKLDEVMAISDRITVMRRGRVVARMETPATSAEEVARAMVGHDVLPDATRAAPAAPDAPLLLEVDGLGVDRSPGVPALADVSLAVRAGEILGVAGVEGNGQTELVEAIMGLRPAARGRVRLGGVDLTPLEVRARLAAGLAHVPEDRHRRGLVLDLTVAENLVLGREDAIAAPFGLWPATLARAAAPLLERYDVRPVAPGAAARALSGGNQQKLVLGRELARGARVILAAHPTRGVDVGAVARIWTELRAARAGGAAILLVSADLAEIFALADRILVLYRGRVAAAFDPHATTVDELGLAMTGAAAAAPAREARS